MRGRGLGILTLIVVFVVGLMVDVDRGNAGDDVPARAPIAATPTP